MDFIIIVLRLIHIFSAVFWVGTTILLFFFIVPTAKKSAPEGFHFLDKLMRQEKLSKWLPIAATLTVVSGLLAYIKDSKGFQIEWMTSASGIQFSIGAVSGIIAFLMGAFVIGPNTHRLGLLQQEMAKTPEPSLEQKNELASLQKKLEFVHKLNVILVVVALAFMIIAPEFEE